jgi:hypothetical protein
LCRIPGGTRQGERLAVQSLCALRVVLSLREQPPPLEPSGQDAHRIGAELPTFGEEFDCIGAAADAFERQGEPHESVLVEAVLFGFEQVERALEVQRLHRDTGGVPGSPRSGSSDEPFTTRRTLALSADSGLTICR